MDWFLIVYRCLAKSFLGPLLISIEPWLSGLSIRMDDLYIPFAKNRLYAPSLA